MTRAFLISTCAANNIRSVLHSSLVMVAVVSFHSMPMIRDSSSHRILKYGPSCSSVRVINLLLSVCESGLPARKSRYDSFQRAGGNRTPTETFRTSQIAVDDFNPLWIGEHPCFMGISRERATGDA